MNIKYNLNLRCPQSQVCISRTKIECACVCVCVYYPLKKDNFDNLEQHKAVLCSAQLNQLLTFVFMKAKTNFLWDDVDHYRLESTSCSSTPVVRTVDWTMYTWVSLPGIPTHLKCQPDELTDMSLTSVLLLSMSCSSSSHCFSGHSVVERSALRPYRQKVLASNLARGHLSVRQRYSCLCFCMDPPRSSHTPR